MTPVDLTDNAAIIAEASRRSALRAAGKALTSEPDPVIEKATDRAWPTAVCRNSHGAYFLHQLPRPRSLALEKNEQGEVLKVFQRFGIRQWKSTSQARKSKIGIGIPDVWVFGPPGSRRSFWWETKAGEGWRFSAAQLEFAHDCAESCTLYGCGDRYAADAFCRALGLEEI